MAQTRRRFWLRGAQAVSAEDHLVALDGPLAFVGALCDNVLLRHELAPCFPVYRLFGPGAGCLSRKDAA